MAASVVRDGQRLIMVINGVATDKDRTDEARKLIDWGYRTFENVRLFAPGDVIGEANVFGGDRPTVALVTRDSLNALMPRTGRDAVKGRVVYQGPVRAPIAKGQPIGILELSLAGQVIRQAPLYAAADVASGSLPQRAVDGVRELLFGWW
jgi:D-alanyl-D-alanine carboxypeptidase (penicillin-binding protein 5/6)